LKQYLVEAQDSNLIQLDNGSVQIDLFNKESILYQPWKCFRFTQN